MFDTWFELPVQHGWDEALPYVEFQGVIEDGKIQHPFFANPVWNDQCPWFHAEGYEMDAPDDSIYTEKVSRMIITPEWIKDAMDADAYESTKQAWIAMLVEKGILRKI